MAKLPERESDILNGVCTWLKLNNFFYWRSNNIPVFGKNNAGVMTFRSMPKHSMKGVPDIIIVREGKFIGVEVKRPKAKMRPDQFIFKALCEANHGEYHVVYSVDDIVSLMTKYL